MTTYLSKVKTSLAVPFKVTVLVNPLPVKMWSTSFTTVPQASCAGEAEQDCQQKLYTARYTNSQKL